MAGELYMDGTKLNRHLGEVLKWKNDEFFTPIHMEISLTNTCNQHCSFCYIDWSHGKEEFSESLGVTLIKDAKKLGVKSALIAGEGEPTLNKSYVKMIETAGEIDFDVALNTNAIVMGDDEINRIIPHLSWMRISVQAADSKTYAQIHKSPESHFDKAISNIKKCADVKSKTNSKVAIGVQQVLMHENAHTVADLATLAKSSGADYYVIKPCHPHELNKAGYKTVSDLVSKNREVLERARDLSDDNFKTIIRWNFLEEVEKPREYPSCLALPFILQIGADGSIYTCYPWAHKPEHTYGNLNENSLEDILKSKNFKNTHQWVRDNLDVSECMSTCRHHNANKYLYWLTEDVPQHVNFI